MPQMFFSHTNVDMITKQYNTETILWQTQLFCVCRLMSGEQTGIVSNSYATYYLVRSSLRKTAKLMSTYGMVWYVRMWYVCMSECIYEKETSRIF